MPCVIESFLAAHFSLRREQDFFFNGTVSQSQALLLLFIKTEVLTLTCNLGVDILVIPAERLTGIFVIVNNGTECVHNASGNNIGRWYDRNFIKLITT